MDLYLTDVILHFYLEKVNVPVPFVPDGNDHSTAERSLGQKILHSSSYWSILRLNIWRKVLTVEVTVTTTLIYKVLY